METFKFYLKLYSAVSLFHFFFVMFELAQSFFIRKQKQKQVSNWKYYEFPETHSLFYQFNTNTIRSLKTPLCLMAVLCSSLNESNTHTQTTKKTKNKKRQSWQCCEMSH